MPDSVHANRAIGKGQPPGPVAIRAARDTVYWSPSASGPLRVARSQGRRIRTCGSIASSSLNACTTELAVVQATVARLVAGELRSATYPGHRA
ncbi:hypothetical protein [Pengzhenrongella frigida]|uniref:Uncharacterized protein n=1 Tax=Pengzhenrongella frigida TaxID=1259133 RepID=A0A4Q5N3C1_9MICO|nr:hypothetical protein [Cellulomonas sp. HLT2-17]RYV52636.1 hypothetical protein EUA98_02780 [Cellulomonas sp. HLT2-17]